MGLLTLASACTGVEHSAPNRAKANVAGEIVELALPVTYCFDDRTSDRNARGAFFLAVTCDAGPGKQNVAITISVANDGLIGDLAALERFLTSDGVALLGKSGAPDKVTVLTSRQNGSALYLKIRDRGKQPIPDAPQTFWRAFFEAGDRMIGLSVTGIAGTRLSDAQATAILSKIVAQTRAVNSGAG